VKGQVAGFIKNWEGFTFLTVRGAGHMVPQYKPEQSLVFFSNWLNKVPF
jgi:carboxypeptidase C (cathepsin A)